MIGGCAVQCYNCDSKRLVYDQNKDAYVCLDCKYEYPKQYFFISHSHLDIEKVRIVRNIVEETFFYEPILFFLKCLSEEEEINNLVRREITERVWFIYCKSRNAERSRFVAEERRFIDQLIQNGYRKKILTVDLDNFEIWDEGCIEDIRRQVSYKIRKARIFLSSEQRDAFVARPLYERLTAGGYNVWWDNDIGSAELWQDGIGKKIKEHSYKDGIFMPVLTGNRLSEWMEREIFAAHDNNALIMPVVIDQSVYENCPPCLSAVQGFVIDPENIGRSADLLLETLDRM